MVLVDGSATPRRYSDAVTSACSRSTARRGSRDTRRRSRGQGGQHRSDQRRSRGAQCAARTAERQDAACAYGPRSERSARLIAHLELAFEDLDADATEAERRAAFAAAKTTTVTAFTRARTPRRDFPAHLPRERVVIAAPSHCACCGSDRLSKLGEDVTCTLERIPASMKIIGNRPIVTACPGCRWCCNPRRY